MSDETVQVFITKDERYPDYTLSEKERSFDYCRTVDKKILARWKRVIKAYKKIQEEIECLVKE